MPTVNHSAKLAATLTALLAASPASALVAARIYAAHAPQASALPRVVWHEIASMPSHCHDSATTSDPGLEETVIQIDIEGRTLTACRAVADAIAVSLDGGTYLGVAHILAGFRETSGSAQALDYSTGDGEAEAYRLSIDYRLLWRDA